MAFDRFLDRYLHTNLTPNPLTTGMGELVRAARKEAGLSQMELAETIHRRQATISDIENGKVSIDAEVLIRLANALGKPLVYFFPEAFIPNAVSRSELSDEEMSLIAAFRELNQTDKDKVRKIISNIIELNEVIQKQIYGELDLPGKK